MNNNFMITILAVALVGSSYMVYKTMVLRSEIQKTSAVLTQIDLSLDILDCNMVEASKMYRVLEDIHGDEDE